MDSYADGFSYQENILSKYHRKMGYDVTIVASMREMQKNGKSVVINNYETRINEQGCKVMRLPYNKFIPSIIAEKLGCFAGVYDTLEQEEPDILFIHGVCIADNSKIIRYIKKHRFTRVYADSHADWINSGTSWGSSHILNGIIRRYFAKMIEPYCTRIYGVLPIRCKYLHEVYGINKNTIQYLPLGIDDDEIPNNRIEVRSAIRKKLNIDETDFVVITGGKIDKRKNIHLLVESIIRLKKEIPNLHLIVFGTVTEEAKGLFNNQVDESIHFVGWADYSQVINYLVSSDMACFPGTHSTLWEETIGIGLPCVFKSWEGMHHVNINDNCILLEDVSPDSISSAISTINRDYKGYKTSAELASLKFKYSEIARNSII